MSFRQSTANFFQNISSTLSRLPVWLRNILLLLVSALSMALSFAPFHIWPLAFIAPFPLFFLVEKYRPGWRRSLWWGFLIGLFLNFAAYNWLLYTLKVFGHIPLSISLVIFIIYSFFFNLRFFLFFYLASIFLKTSENSPKAFFKSPYLIFPLAWGIAEFVGWQLFPWFGGNLTSSNPLYIQFIDITGIRGASLIWIVIAYSLYAYFYKGEKKRIHYAMGSLLIAAHLYGAVAMLIHRDVKNPKEVLKVGLVQGNTPLSFSRMRKLRDQLNEIVTNMVDQSIAINEQSIKEEKRKLDVIVWPESSTPFLRYQTSVHLREEIERLQQATQTDLLVNDILTDIREGRSYSNMALFNKLGKYTENYQKVFLLPFGEYIPFSDLYPPIKDVIPEISDFTPGSRYVLLPLKKMRVLPTICYEIIHPEFVRGFFTKTGMHGRVIINITNDTWYGHSYETYQHLGLARMRAIELRRPLVRAVNSGVSAYIDRTGIIHGKTEMFKKENRIYKVQPGKETHTIYALIGNFPLYIFFLFGVVSFTFIGFKWGRKKQSEEREPGAQ